MKLFYSFLFICLICIQPLFSMDKTISWKFTNPQNQQEVNLGEKGSVQEALIKNGYLADPYIGMNENLFGWIEEHIWELNSEFFVTESELNAQIIEIELPSVDTYAKIYLNGELILSCDNAFLPYRIAINKYVKAGKNELKAVFTPPVLYHKEMYDKAAYKLPAPNDVHKTAIAPYTRKPQYQFGWDWALRMNTIGFNKPVKIVTYNENKIILSSVQTIELKENEATISIALQLAQEPTANLQWNSQLFGKINWKKEQNNWIKAIVKVNNPQLWWPIQYGSQFLYSDEWSVTNASGEIIDGMTKKFGIRTAQLLQPKDDFGTAYEIVVNGIKLFCKGGDLIPQEMFPAKVTPESIRDLVEQMSLANFNMVRVWGGGYYPDDVFYETCDEKGIMVWQDFMFACAMYPGTADFLANVKREFDFHIPRMTSHPSVVLLNGNNEVEVAWNNWGFQIKYGLIGKSVTEIERAYTDLFKKLIPERVTAYTSIPYIHTSPLSNWGKADYYNHGSQHYWGVWHGKDPIEDFGNKIGRFNSEYGFQSFPEYSTLSTAIDKKDWNLDSEVMKHRQKSYVGNGMIKKHSDILFGKTDDFETFIYYSQLTQSKAVSMAIAGHRTDWPRCAGTLYWQVNDCWPAPTWSSMDYYGNWKALHYEAKKDFENIAVVAVERKLNQKEFYLVSDWTEEYTNDVSFDFYDLNGKWLAQYTFIVDVHPQSVIPLPVFELMDKPVNDFITVISWKTKEGKELSRTIHNTASKISSTSPKVELQLQQKENGQSVIVLTTDKPLFNCWIYSETKPFHLNQNFETLLPGRFEFELTSKEKITIEDIKVRYLNQ